METKLDYCEHHGLTVFKKYSGKNKFYCVECNKKSVTNRRKNNKKLLVEYKGGKCEICGYDKCIEALEFHHIEKSEKDFSIGELGYKNIEELKKEADKCLLVCANCHREIHSKQAAEKEKEEAKRILENKQKFGEKPKIEEEKLISYIELGLKRPEIAQKFGVSISTLRRFMSNHGINLNRRKIIEQKINVPTKEELLEMREKGLSYAKIGKQTGWSRNYITLLCKRLSIN